MRHEYQRDSLNWKELLLMGGLPKHLASPSPNQG